MIISNVGNGLFGRMRTLPPPTATTVSPADAAASSAATASHHTDQLVTLANPVDAAVDGLAALAGDLVVDLAGNLARDRGAVLDHHLLAHLPRLAALDVLDYALAHLLRHVATIGLWDLKEQ